VCPEILFFPAPHSANHAAPLCGECDSDSMHPSVSNKRK
jgi:hypothetical protein